ncbi:MAG: DUF882 domain-containing protein [Hyphomicrobiaceae bacterium]|nr:MAG: DUF882 domain-containing protein [Hyphomicrobiaceae bacterium]
MSKRLLTATIAIALGVLATPVVARTYDSDHSPRYRHDDGERARAYRAERDDDEEVTRRSHRRYVAKSRQRSKSVRRGNRNRSIANRSLRRYASSGTGTSRTCLTSAARALLGRIEAKFGRVQIVSTCRPGAVIAGTGRPSKHASGQAIDFNAPSGRKAEVVRWLIANHKAGGVMTYSGMNHIHVDIGHHFVSLNSRRG